jgi:aldehyde:ferredoxin oxidoreductase
MMLYDPMHGMNVAVSDRGDCGGYMFSDTQGWASWPWSSNILETREGRETHTRSGFFKWPPEYEKYFLADFSQDGIDYEPGCQLHSYAVEGLALYDSAGFCHRTTAWTRSPPVNSRAILAELISDTIGVDIDETELTKTADRIVNLSRAYARRFSLTRQDDTVPKIYFEQDPEPPRQRLRHEVFDKWIDRFYELRGWDKEGIPTKETLEKVGLGYVWEELKKRGIATEEKVLTVI